MPSVNKSLSYPFSDPKPPPTLTVSQLNRQARSLLESHFDFVWVEGEVSNFAAPGSGHWYFTLKDGKAQVRCAMFRNRNQRVKVMPANGDALRLRCRVSLYEGRGEFQLIVEHLEPAGAGALQAAFEKLKSALQKEGMFDPQRKHALPETVSRLGVITSPTGAAIHDILTVLRRRDPGIEVSLLPVAVQGEAAAAEIAAAIARANSWQEQGRIELDALLVGRGGGSLEDLWAFNEEVVARAIAASRLPVVAAVGHEVDFSIADMVADQRAATPSAAAELLSVDRGDSLQRLRALEQDLFRQARRTLAQAASELRHLRARLKHPGFQLREQAQRLDDLEQRLRLSQVNALARHHNRLALLQNRLRGASPAGRVQQSQQYCSQLQERLEVAGRHRIAAARTRLNHLGQMLDSLSPLKTLDRGYAIVTDEAGAVVTDAAGQQQGNRVRARLARGSLKLVVETIET